MSLIIDLNAGPAAQQGKRSGSATILKLFAAAMVLGVSVASSPAGAKPRDFQVNRPAAQPYACIIDEGYGRWTSCDQGGS
jgi:hypothetical protein